MVVCGSLVAMWVSEMAMEFKPHLILGIEVPFRICAPTVLLTCEIIWITGNFLRRVLARAGKLFASRCVPCVGFTLALFFWLQNLFKQDKFRVVRLLVQALEVECVVELLFALKRLVKTEIIMPLFQCVEANVLVVGVKWLLFVVLVLSHLGVDVPARNLVW